MPILVIEQRSYYHGALLGLAAGDALGTTAATVRKQILHLLRVCLSLACRRGLRRPTEIIHQDIDAD